MEESLPIPSKKSRPKLDCAQVAKQAVNGATPQEIADFLGFPLRRVLCKCGKEFAKGVAQRHVKLRVLQDKLAIEGNPQVLMHLGKAELGQSGNGTPQATIPEPRLPYKMG